ncbi:hypothetical protein EhV156_00333 [Emiliania huxleyi virus 156]|nr:hypothetical protein EhV156_00333 [Emiliania huxleyi virus 156]
MNKRKTLKKKTQMKKNIEKRKHKKEKHILDAVGELINETH